MITGLDVEELIVMKSILRKTLLWAAALTVAAAGALTVGPEFAPATAKPPPCSKASNCAGAAGTGGTNAKGSRLVTTAAGHPTIETFSSGGTVPPSSTCETFGGCKVGTATTGTPTLVASNSPAPAGDECLSNQCAFEFNSPATTVTQEGSANGGRTVTIIGTNTSVVTGHH